MRLTDASPKFGKHILQSWTTRRSVIFGSILKRQTTARDLELMELINLDIPYSLRDSHSLIHSFVYLAVHSFVLLVTSHTRKNLLSKYIRT